MKVKRYRTGGGVVLRGDQVLLLRKRTNGEIVLPKGHVEAGETLEQAAVRETQEESGYQHVRVLADLGCLRADYHWAGKHIIRDETYFLMELLDEARSVAGDHDDAEYDRNVFEPLWVPLAGAAARLTFEPSRTFVQRAADWKLARS